MIVALAVVLWTVAIALAFLSRSWRRRWRQALREEEAAQAARDEARAELLRQWREVQWDLALHQVDLQLRLMRAQDWEAWGRMDAPEEVADR